MFKFRYSRKPRPHHNRRSIPTIDDLQTNAIIKQYKKPGRVTVKEVAKASGKTPQTLFYHFKDISDTLIRLNEDVITELQEYLYGGIFRGSDNEINRDVFTICFDFMGQRSKIFYQLSLHDSPPELIYIILKILYQHIQFPNYPLPQKPKVSDPKVKIYLCSLVCVFQRWGVETGCDVKQSEPYMKELLALTAEAARKLR